MTDTTQPQGRKQSGFKRIAQDKGSRNLLIFAGVAIAGAVGYSMVGGTNAPSAQEGSQVRSAPTLNPTQGGAQVTPQYSRALSAADQQRAEQARKSANASAIPTVQLGTQSGDLKAGIVMDAQDEKAAEAPVVRPTPQPKADEVPARAPGPLAATPPTLNQQGRAAGPDQNLVANYQKQMAELTKAMAPVAARTVFYYSPDDAARAAAQGAAPAVAAPAQQAATAQAATAPAAGRFQAPVAGTILYARLVGRVNSDVPGPVIAEILQGPFAGARLLGGFDMTEEGVVITFKTMTVAFSVDGEARSEVVPIDAVAVDTTHLGVAMATDIDRHMFQKIAFGFATSFLSGLGQAVAQSGSTTTTSVVGSTTTNPVLDAKDKLLVASGAAAQTTGQILQNQYGNRKTTITVEADTPFGLLFLGTRN